METNLCKSEENVAENSTEMEYLKKHKHRPIDDAQNPFLAKHVLNLSCIVQIEVGCLYELDHTKLPPKSPIQLKSVRAVMVTEKTELNVSVMFPSILSLRTYFSSNDLANGNIHPELDEQFVMGSNIAGKVLMKRVSSQEFDKQKHLRSFWLVPPEATEMISTSIIKEGGSKDDPLMKGMCWSALKYDGLVHWGVRRRVTFIGRHKVKNPYLTSDVVKEEEVEAKVEEPNRKTRKRKPEREKKEISSITYSTRNNLKLSKDRWSIERYMLAEGKILEIMKDKRAVFGNPMLRPALRLEARKHIGDTGLLDHLLKHMAGKVAPGGTDRFRRRHNADGAMEYWLESADLINIRREAGVQDPYWTPPLGWKLGDSPSQDPICARELKLLKEEMGNMKRDVKELLSKKQEDDKANLTTPKSSCDNFKKESETSVLLQEMYKDLVKRKEEVEQQLKEISKSLKGMEEEMQRITSAMEESGKLEGAEKEKTESEEKRKEEEEMEEAEAEKAAKRQRLRSGFRICKPQGTFLWPNMGGSCGSNMLSPQVVVQVEDLLVVPTPPSASSATSAPRLLAPPIPPPSHHHALHPTSPVKPLAERRAVTVTVSSIVIPPDSACEGDNISTTSLHLNDGTNNSNGFCGTPSSSYSAYQRHTLTTTPNTIPRISSAGEEVVVVRGDQVVGSGSGSSSTATVRKEMIQYQRQHQGGCSSLSVGAGTWLALATPNPSLDEANRG